MMLTFSDWKGVFFTVLIQDTFQESNYQRKQTNADSIIMAGRLDFNVVKLIVPKCVIFSKHQNYRISTLITKQNHVWLFTSSAVHQNIMIFKSVRIKLLINFNFIAFISIFKTIKPKLIVTLKYLLYVTRLLFGHSKCS